MGLGVQPEAEEIQLIGRQALAVATHVNSRVEVMHFVGVHPESGLPEVLPWFFRESPPVPNPSSHDLVANRSRTARRIRSSDELLSLTADPKEIEKARRTGIRLAPDANHIRNQLFLDAISEFAIAQEVPVELEGSVLSHGYYVLGKAGVRVRCVDHEEPPAIVGAQSFGKLVRDRLPELIEKGGERALGKRATKAELVELLKEKLFEESLELGEARLGSDMIEEAADVFEVLRALVTVIGYDEDDLSHMADQKRQARGGFETGFVLRETYIRPIGASEADDNALFSIHEVLDEDVLPVSRNTRVELSSIRGGGGDDIDDRIVIRVPWLGVGAASEGPYDLSQFGLPRSLTVRWRRGSG